MYCPICKSEYVEGIYRCEECDADLVETLPEDIPDRIQKECEDYQCVFYPISSQEVALVRMILEREKIPYFIKNDRLHGSIIFSIRGPGRIEVLVPASRADVSRRLLVDELGHE